MTNRDCTTGHCTKATDTSKAPARHYALVVGLLLLSSCRSPPGGPNHESGQVVNVMTSGGFAAAYKALAPRFENSTGLRLNTAYGPSTGGASHSIPIRLARGEPADLIILSRPSLVDLTECGDVIAGSRVDLADSSIGMAVKSGAPKPNIATAEAFVSTLLGAKSIGYSGSLSGNYLSKGLFPRLGIWARLEPKGKRIVGEPVGTAVARGEVEVGFQQISELLAVEGVDYVGPLPDEYQKVSTFSAGLTIRSRNPEGAQALLDFLSSEDATREIEAVCLEPKNRAREPGRVGPWRIRVSGKASP